MDVWQQNTRERVKKLTCISYAHFWLSFNMLSRCCVIFLFRCISLSLPLLKMTNSVSRSICAVNQDDDILFSLIVNFSQVPYGYGGVAGCYDSEERLKSVKMKNGNWFIFERCSTWMIDCSHFFALHFSLYSGARFFLQATPRIFHGLVSKRAN